jgi:hypothetical protein
VTPEAADHRQDLTGFLRDNPYVRLTLGAELGVDDMQMLHARAIVTRIQRLQRQDGLADFGEAAQRLWSSVHCRSPAPSSPQKIVQALAERAPAPIDAARELAERRLEATRTELIKFGVAPDRVQRADGTPSIVRAADGRVEFEMHSAS